MGGSDSKHVQSSPSDINIPGVNLTAREKSTLLALSEEKRAQLIAKIEKIKLTTDMRRSKILEDATKKAAAAANKPTSEPKKAKASPIYITPEDQKVLAALPPKIASKTVQALKKQHEVFLKNLNTSVAKYKSGGDVCKSFEKSLIQSPLEPVNPLSKKRLIPDGATVKKLKKLCANKSKICKNPTLSMRGKPLNPTSSTYKLHASICSKQKPKKPQPESQTKS